MNMCQAEGSVLSATHSASTLPEVEAPPEDEVAGSVLFVSTPSDSDGLAYAKASADLIMPAEYGETPLTMMERASKRKRHRKYRKSSKANK